MVPFSRWIISFLPVRPVRTEDVLSEVRGFSVLLDDYDDYFSKINCCSSDESLKDGLIVLGYGWVDEWVGSRAARL